MLTKIKLIIVIVVFACWTNNFVSSQDNNNQKSKNLFLEEGSSLEEIEQTLVGFIQMSEIVNLVNKNNLYAIPRGEDYEKIIEELFKFIIYDSDLDKDNYLETKKNEVIKNMMNDDRINQISIMGSAYFPEAQQYINDIVYSLYIQHDQFQTEFNKRGIDITIKNEEVLDQNITQLDSDLKYEEEVNVSTQQSTTENFNTEKVIDANNIPCDAGFSFGNLLIFSFPTHSTTNKQILDLDDGDVSIGISMNIVGDDMKFNRKFDVIYEKNGKNLNGSTNWSNVELNDKEVEKLGNFPSVECTILGASN